MAAPACLKTEYFHFLYNRDMQRIVPEDTVEFRQGEKHMYGTVLKETKDDEGRMQYTILAEKLIYRGIPEEDILKDFGQDL
jgi:hypothetical protein